MRAGSAFAAIFLTHASAALAADMAVQLHPTIPLIERTRLGQAINFDFEMTNAGPHILELVAVRAFVHDPAGTVVQRLEVNDNGSLAGIDTVPNRIWKPGESRTIFNPFHTLASDIRIGRIDFEFLFKDEREGIVTERRQVQPAPYAQKTRLILPMQGRVLVWDGHDFYSHHRRWDFSNKVLRGLGLITNPARYSLDLVAVDDEARLFRGQGETREDYYSHGATIVAPAAGTVVAAAADASDKPAEPTGESLANDPMFAIYGNYIVIDHGNGEFSQLGHLKKGSLTVRVGDQVRQAQPIAQAGASGTSLFPHLHYQLVTRPGVDGEGLPPRFAGLVRVGAAPDTSAADIWIDSGDIVDARPAQ